MLHLLLIDDDKECLTALANRLQFAFRDQDVEVDLADSASAGLLLSHVAHDAVIVDAIMPGLNGIKFIEQLRQTQPHVPVIVISGDDIHTWDPLAARHGVVACLPKPVDFSELLGILSGVLDS